MSEMPIADNGQNQNEFENMAVPLAPEHEEVIKAAGEEISAKEAEEREIAIQREAFAEKTTGKQEDPPNSDSKPN